jgi:hypothetical protein
VYIVYIRIYITHIRKTPAIIGIRKHVLAADGGQAPPPHVNGGAVPS